METIWLRCPQCKRTKKAAREDSDPPDTAVVQALCPECDTGGLKPGVDYFDAGGNQLECV